MSGITLAQRAQSLLRRNPSQRRVRVGSGGTSVHDEIDRASLRVFRALRPRHDWARSRASLRVQRILARLSPIRLADLNLVPGLLTHSRHHATKPFLQRRIKSHDRPIDPARRRIARQQHRRLVVGVCFVRVVGFVGFADVALVVRVLGILSVGRCVQLRRSFRLFHQTNRLLRKRLGRAGEQTRERDLPGLFVEPRLSIRHIDWRRHREKSGDTVRHLAFACIERLLRDATRSGGSSAMIDAA